MDAGVGATGTLGQRSLAGDTAQSGLQLALDGGLSGLNLPAAELRAVVGQGQLPGLQAGSGLGDVGHGYLVQISGYSKASKNMSRNRVRGRPVGVRGFPSFPQRTRKGWGAERLWQVDIGQIPYIGQVLKTGGRGAGVGYTQLSACAGGADARRSEEKSQAKTGMAGTNESLRA